MMPKQTHILVVDDDAGHLATLKTIARSWGYRVSTADDGSIAVELAKEQPFDLILMDVRMAEVDGIEALRQIKIVQAFNHQPAYDAAFQARVESAFAVAVRRVRQRSVLVAVVMLLVLSAVATMLWVGGQDVLSGDTCDSADRFDDISWRTVRPFVPSIQATPVHSPLAGLPGSMP